jgi:hypothetical protein
VTRVRRVLAHPGAALLALALVAYSYFYQAGGWNQNSRFDLTRAIVEDGTVRIDRFERNTGDEACRVGARVCPKVPRGQPRPKDHAFYTDKAPGISLLGVPAWALGHALAGERPSPRALAIGAWAATVLAVGLPSAMAVVALLLIALALGASRPQACAVAAAWALATLAWPYATLMYGHQTLAALLVIALALVLTTASVTPRRAAAIGAVLGLAVMVEYTAVLGALPIVVLALRRGPWRGVLLGGFVGALPPAIALAAYHTAAFGGPLTLPYEFSTQPHRHQGAFMGLGAPDPDALWGILGSSYRGLFYAAPWLLLALPGGVLLWRAGQRAVVLVCASIAVLFVWMNASLVDWQGGWAMGPRYLVPAIPFLVLLTLGVARVLPAAGWWRRAGVGALALATAGSAYLMLAGTAVKPEVPTHIKAPFASYLLPRFHDAQLAVSTQSIDMVGERAGGPPQAWNLGQALGLHGGWSLVPLLLALAACGAWLVWTLRRPVAAAPAISTAPPA